MVEGAGAMFRGCLTDTCRRSSIVTRGEVRVVCKSKKGYKNGQLSITVSTIVDKNLEVDHSPSTL